MQIIKIFYWYFQISMKFQNLKIIFIVFPLFCTTSSQLAELSHKREFRGRSNPNFNNHADGYYYPDNLTKREQFDEKLTTRVFRTYGRGRAEVRQGETVYVPNELARTELSRGKVAIRVAGRNENEVKPNRPRGGCKECPINQTVVATKGNTSVILPEPCPFNVKMWNHHSGPRPGSKIREGVHFIVGSIGPKKKYCQYRYEVLVRRCETLKAENGKTLVCSAENAWGSTCTVTCENGKELQGPGDLECTDDLIWSQPVPQCKSKTDCSSPKVKANSKISCQTTNFTLVEGEFMPQDSTCRFNKNGREVSITCKDGTWRISRKAKYSVSKKNKSKSKPQQEKVDPCDPNPCQNGGTCFRTDSNKERFFCSCRPQTQGQNCEMRECDYNICENYGLCFFQNNERICYCSTEYSGDRCQYYTPN